MLTLTEIKKGLRDGRFDPTVDENSLSSARLEKRGGQRGRVFGFCDEVRCAAQPDTSSVRLYGCATGTPRVTKFMKLRAWFGMSATSWLGALAACSSNDTGNAGAPLGPAVDASVCTFPLVTMRTGPSSDCSASNTHTFPVGMAATDCHGWQALDTSGKQHDNSANHITCNPDGSFSFTQYPGVLDCSSTGNVKTYTLNACTQDTPPSLCSMAVDLTCCAVPNAAGCTKGVPSTSQDGSLITFNNQPCGKRPNHERELRSIESPREEAAARRRCVDERRSSARRGRHRRLCRPRRIGMCLVLSA